jgi:hypothetical protein
MTLKTLGCGLATAALLAGPATAAVARTDDAQLAQGALVTVRDFPSGWTESDSSDRTPVACKATAHARSVATGIGLSGVFRRGDDRSAATAVYVFADAATAAREWHGVSADTPRCYARALKRTINATAGFRVRSIKTTTLRVKPAGDQHAAAHVRAAVAARGRHVVVHVDLVFVRAGRSLSLALFQRTQTRFDRTLRTRLTAVQAGRLP